jgi:hypothetical protein
VGGLRAVLGYRSGGLRLPQAKAPSTVARLVILFGPESYSRAPVLLCCGVGVGRENWRSSCWECTPPRKIRIRFQGYKHTSLTFLVGKSLKLSIVPVLCGTVSNVILEIRNTAYV